jgi:hypothetical protein
MCLDPSRLANLTSMTNKHFDSSRWLSGALNILLTLLDYFPSIRGGFVWDGDMHISANQTLHSLGGLRDIWLEPGTTYQYYPLTLTGFWIGYHLW